MRVLDSHVHLWRIGGPGQVWPDADWPRLYRDFLPDDLRAATTGLDWAGGVLVQSQPNDSDTDWMLRIAADDPLIAAVVGWVDLADARAPDRIATLADAPKLRGVRLMLQGIADTDWILHDDLLPAIDALVAHDLTFDALIEPRHLPVLDAFARRWPTLPIVIDHAAKPRAAQDTLDPWRDEMAALAERPNIWCKLSGLRTEQAPGQPADALAPYVDHLVACFPDRLMWGSDWPVLLHAGDGYADWIAASLDLLGDIGADHLAGIFVEAARRFYRISA